VDSISLISNDTIEQILEKYSDTVYRIAFSKLKNKADADDLTQEVFLRYIRFKPTFENSEHEKAWFIRTTINCSINLVKSAWFRKTDPLEDNLTTELAEKSEVYYAVLELDEKYRTVVHLFYYEDLTIQEISNVLQKKETTVKSLLHRARNKLKQKLEGDYDYV